MYIELDLSEDDVKRPYTSIILQLRAALSLPKTTSESFTYFI
jgi:hypothetical protein